MPQSAALWPLLSTLLSFFIIRKYSDSMNKWREKCRVQLGKPTLEAIKSPLFPLRKSARFPYLQNSTMTIRGPAQSNVHSHVARNDDEGQPVLGLALSWSSVDQKSPKISHGISLAMNQSTDYLSWMQWQLIPETAGWGKIWQKGEMKASKPQCTLLWYSLDWLTWRIHEWGGQGPWPQAANSCNDEGKGAPN